MKIQSGVPPNIEGGSIDATLILNQLMEYAPRKICIVNEEDLEVFFKSHFKNTLSI